MPRFAWLLFTGLLVALGPARLAHAEEDAPGAARPPLVEYAGSRESKRWIELPGGTSVAVDVGATWRGVTVYLALTWHLVAVDEATSKVLWDRNVGAYWNVLTFAEVERAAGGRVWAVELRPRAGDPERAQHRAYFDLASGEPIEVAGPDGRPSGDPFEPRAFQGDLSHVARPFHVIAVNAAGLEAVRARLWDEGEAPDVGQVDFERQVVLVVSDGDGWNARGIVCTAAFEDEVRILVRTDRSSFQTAGGGMKVRPWGVFILPRREGKAYVVERDTQDLIGGPSIFRETFRVPALPDPEKALEGLPPRSETPHHGWTR